MEYLLEGPLVGNEERSAEKEGGWMEGSRDGYILVVQVYICWQKHTVHGVEIMFRGHTLLSTAHF